MLCVTRVKILAGAFAGLSGVRVEDGEIELALDGRVARVFVEEDELLREDQDARAALRTLVAEDRERQAVERYLAWWSGKEQLTDAQLAQEAIRYKELNDEEGVRLSAWEADTLAAFDAAFPETTPDLIDRFDAEQERWIPGAIAQAQAHLSAEQDPAVSERRSATSRLGRRAFRVAFGR